MNTEIDDKAKELVEKFMLIIPDSCNRCDYPIIGKAEKAKQCALICVDEISKVVPYLSKSNADTIEQMRAPNYFF